MATRTTNEEAISSATNEELVTLCAWSNTVKYEGEWMPFVKYLEHRFGVLATHGISPAAAEKLDAEIDSYAQAEEPRAANAVNDPKRLAAVRSSGLLDSPALKSFDRITRLGATLLSAPATFISLVDENRDFYLSHFGFGEPLASERQLSGQTFCHLTVQGDKPVVIGDTRADPVYSKVPTVTSLGVAAYLGIPLVLPSGEVIGAFCAIDFSPHAWDEAQVTAAADLASLVVSEIELRQAAIDFQRKLSEGPNP